MLEDIRGVTLDEFGIAPSVIDGCIVLQLKGTGDVIAANPLRECLDAVQREVLSGGITAIEFDMRGLLLLNSSCLKVFASFLIPLVSDKAACPIRFVVDSKQPWQARSLFALERLASTLVTVVPR